MALSYSLHFIKQNLAGKVLLEKEGEIVFNRQYFRLKGKGANDQGEVINFTDIKEIREERDRFLFVTFTKYKYVLSKFGTSFQNFLEDFYRVKNDYFAESLFMKVGMLQAEFDCNAEVTNQFGKVVNKGPSVIHFFEQSIVIIPKMSDAFVIYLNFMKMHEFDEEEYVLNLEADSGLKVRVSRLGSHFDEAKHAMENNLEKMYQRVLNQLNTVFGGIPLPVLLKLAYIIRDGRCVGLHELKKIDASLPQKALEIAFEGNLELEKRVQFLRSLDNNEQFYLGFAFENTDRGRDVKVKAWFLCALPGLNTMVLGISNDQNEKSIFFFRIVMEQGIPSDKVSGKILEINQCMVLFNYDLSPIYKEKHELRRSKYRTALLKLAFLRLFRRSFLGRTEAMDMDKFKSDANKYFSMARVLHRPLLRHRQIFKPALK